jgi:hypothetical protein
MHSRFLLAALAVLAAACSPSGYLTGNIEGDAFVVRDAVFVPVRSPGGPVFNGALLMSDTTDLCKTLRRGRVPSSSMMLAMSVWSLTSNGPRQPIEGDYQVISGKLDSLGNIAFGTALEADSACASRKAAENLVLTGGHLSFESLDTGLDGRAEGSIDITVGTQRDRLRGRFNAEICEATTKDLSCD